VFRTCVRSLRFALFVGVARTGCGLAGRASAECPMEERCHLASCHVIIRAVLVV